MGISDHPSERLCVGQERLSLLFRSGAGRGKVPNRGRRVVKKRWVRRKPSLSPEVPKMSASWRGVAFYVTKDGSSMGVMMLNHAFEDSTAEKERVRA